VLIIIEELLEEILTVLQAHNVREHPVCNALKPIVTYYNVTPFYFMTVLQD
jgi:hypothetical protein